MLLPVHIALLELKRYLLDWGELGFSIALPVMLFALIYGAFGGEESFHATAHLVDLDRGPHARALIARLDALDEVTVNERSMEDADLALDRSAILLAVVIPSGFTAGIDSGGPVGITFKKRGNGGNSGQIVEALVRAISQDIGGEVRAIRAVTAALGSSTIPQDRIEAEVRASLAASQDQPAVGVKVRQLGTQSSDPIYRLVPGLLVMFLLFAVTIGAQTLVTERQNGTLERLMTTRLGPNQLFLGKFLSGVVRATVQAIILLLLAFAVLRIGDPVDFGELVISSVLVAAAASAIGLVIGSVARTRDQAIWAAVFFTMFMTVFGGTFFDVSANGPLDILSRLTLTRYSVDAMFGMLSGGETLVQQGVGATVLVSTTVFSLVIARVLFRTAGGGR